MSLIPSGLGENRDHRVKTDLTVEPTVTSADPRYDYYGGAPKKARFRYPVGCLI